MKTNVVVTLQVEGLHCWPECNIEDVKFLSYKHRHLFYITCKTTVAHEDRDVEIIMLKHKVHSYLSEKYASGKICDFHSMSCEMLARELVDEFNLTYCSVLEDNENGAEVINE